jgi:hypothetical protein
MSKFTEYLEANKKGYNPMDYKPDDESYVEEEPEDNLMDDAADFLSKLNNNKEIKLAIKNLNSLIKTKYNELLNLKYKKNKKDMINMIDNLLSDLDQEDYTIVDNAILNNFK